VRERLATIPEVEDAEVAGAVRRRLEVIANVEIVVSTRAPEKVIEAIRRRGLLDAIDVAGDTLRGTVRNEMEAVLHLAAPNAFGSALLVATGSEEFLEAFRQRAAIPARARTEEETFAKAGLTYVHPERRENGDDLARKRRRTLVEPADLRGTFHVHTTFSDGRNTVFEMLDAARARDFEYVGISDHSKAAYYARGLTEEGLREQQAEIEKQRPSVAPLRVFKGSEADILPDGTIDYDLTTLAGFDFGMQKDEMTERILHALDNPYVTFLGHLTGRLLLSRDGYTIDFDRVFDRAAERGVMIEINGNPHRLDVDWRHIRNALSRGVRFCINPDAHSIAEYAAVISGTWVARKGGLPPREIFNTRSVEEVEAFFAARKQKPAL
jgi:DNA polymerase (family 10)